MDPALPAFSTNGTINLEVDARRGIVEGKVAILQVVEDIKRAHGGCTSESRTKKCGGSL